MYSTVNFKVVWPKLLFKSRPQLPCRDATSLNAFAGFNWSLLMSRHQYLVATSAQVFCSLQLMFMMSQPQSLVATSAYVLGGFTGCFRCRDFSLLSRQLLQLNHLHSSQPVIASRRFSCRDLNSLIATSSISRHHDAVATSFP